MFKRVEFSQLVCLDILLTQTHMNFSIPISLSFGRKQSCHNVMCTFPIGSKCSQSICYFLCTVCHTKWYTRLFCFVLSLLYHKFLNGSYFQPYSSGLLRLRDCPGTSEAILQNRCKSNDTKTQQMKTLRIYFWVHRHQQLTASTVSVILCVRYMFALYTQMVVGLAVIRPVRTHVTALTDTLVTKVRGNVLTAARMATRLITGGVVHGVVLDVSSVSYKTEQEFVWW